MTWIHSDRPLRDHCERQSISEVLEAAKTGPVTLEVASCARPAPLLNHRPLPPQSRDRLGTDRGSDVARICAGPASGCDARALPLPWCRRPSSLPYSYLQRLAELLVARRCCCHPTAAVGARPPDREPTFRRACYRVGPAPCASGVSSPRSAAPLRPSRAARRRDGCRGGYCVNVCVCIVCGATRAMRATRARGAST